MFTATDELHEKFRDQAAKALKNFPLPSQNLTSTENYRRILAWLYSNCSDSSVASLIVKLDAL